MPLPISPAICLLALFPFCLSAQDIQIKYGKVPKEDLDMKTYAADTGAAAVVLFDYGEISFEFPDERPRVNLLRHKRIKILKRAGYGQGDILIPFYHTGTIKNLKAQVIAPDGKETEVPKKNIFEEKVNNYWSQVRFAFSNLCEGCILEYRYDYKVPYIFTLPEWYFQEDIPVRWSEIQLEVPTWYEYVYIHQGRKPDIMENEKGTNNYSVTELSGGSYRNNADVVRIRMVAKDMPGLKKEAFITTMDDYYARTRFQLSGIRYPTGPYEPIMSDWEKVAKELLEDKDFGGRFLKKGGFDKLWEAAFVSLIGAETPGDKIAALYRFVNSSFVDDGDYSFYARSSLDDLYERKSARSGEMNLALVALLREAGIDAYPLLVSTRNHGQPIPLYPMLDQFNHVLAVVETEGNPPLLLDAGSSHRPPGLPDINSLNRMGWVVDADKPHWIDIEPPIAADTYFGTFQLDEDGNLSGNVQVAGEGYSAASRREEYAKKAEVEYWKSDLGKRYPDVSVDSFSVEGKNDPEQQLREKFSCRLPAYAQVSGDFIYLSPVFYSSFYENPFKLEKRNYPVDIPYPFRERVVFDLYIPAGYRVESLPEPARLALPENGARFQYSVSHKDNKITMNCSLQISQLHYEPEGYDILRSFFGMAVEKFGEQIVLKKM